MPSSIVQSFSEPDDYAAAIQPTTTEVTITGRGRFEATLVSINFRRILLRRFYQSLPCIRHSAHREYASFQFLTQPGPSAFVGGVEYALTKVVRHVANPSYHGSSSGPIHFAGISIPAADMAAIGIMAGIDLAPPRDTMLVAAEPTAMARLQRLHAVAAQLAETTPEIIAHPDAAEGLGQTLVDALVGCLSGANTNENNRRQQQHAIIMRRFRRVLEENSDRPLFIPEICGSIGVAARTLQVCCHEHLGIGPRRYLTLRRMHLVRHTLRQSSSGGTTVTDVATRLGFWHLARFASEYRSLFGELPSATLRRKA